MWRRRHPPRQVQQERPRTTGLAPCWDAKAHPDCLKLLSFNIQVGIGTHSYRHYLTRSWQHLLPHAQRMQNLQRIAALIASYDLVALQEVDGGSLRSGYVNQVEYLAQIGNFPYWYQQLNRNFGTLAQHSNGLLSRVDPQRIEDHPLPGPAGRGAILSYFGHPPHQLLVVVMHLALGRATRSRQLNYLREHLSQAPSYILMGDLNATARELLEHSPLADLGARLASLSPTFPSWRPRRQLDHILLSPNLTLRRAEVLPIPISDHLPIAVEIAWPHALTAQKPAPTRNVLPS